MSQTLSAKSNHIDEVAQQAANKASRAIAATKRVADETLDQLQDGVDSLRDEAPSALSRATAKLDELSSQGMERARQVAGDVRQRVEQTSDRTVMYIKDEPVKSVLIAAAAGAALAAVVGLLAQRRNTRD